MCLNSLRPGVADWVCIQTDGPFSPDSGCLEDLQAVLSSKSEKKVK